MISPQSWALYLVALSVAALFAVVVISVLLRTNATLKAALGRVHQLNGELAASEAKFRHLLESAPDAMVIVDRSGRVVLVNAQTERLFGVPRHELLGQPVERLIPTADRQAHVDLVRTYMASPKARPMGTGRDLLGMTKGGALVPVEVSLSPILGDREGLVCAVVRDVSERRAAENLQALLIHELNHRVKNTLATVQSIARQTMKTASDPAAFCDALNARLMALSQSHNVLTRNDWAGASLAEVLSEQLRPYQRDDGGRFSFAGPDVKLSPRFTVALGMVFGELATNAAKYGALSTEAGRIDVQWAWGSRDGQPALRLVWRETGGPSTSRPPDHGFGSLMIERSLSSEMGGSAAFTYEAAGLVCELRFCPEQDRAEAA
jgi:PAS domain S-box-containing protein